MRELERIALEPYYRLRGRTRSRSEALARKNPPGPSYRNILRFGLAEQHVVAHRLRARQSTAA
jgi:hypothetical protein